MRTVNMFSSKTNTFKKTSKLLAKKENKEDNYTKNKQNGNDVIFNTSAKKKLNKSKPVVQKSYSLDCPLCDSAVAVASKQRKTRIGGEEEEKDALLFEKRKNLRRNATVEEVPGRVHYYLSLYLREKYLESM